MSKSSEKKRIKRRILYVAITAIALIGGVILGWGYLANQIEQRLEQRVERLAAQGKKLECVNQDVRGFPFRVGLFCDEISYVNKAGDTFFKAAQLRSAAQFYQPGFVVSEIDSPALLKTSGLIDLNLDWKLARASSRIGIKGVERLSVAIDDLRITGATGILKGAPVSDLDRLEFHVRPAGNDSGSPDIEVAITAENTRFVSTAAKRMPPLDIKLDGVVKRLNKVIRTGKDLNRWVRIHGVYLQVHKLELTMENGARLSASGPLKIARDGLLEGKLDVEVDGLQKLVEYFTTQNPQLIETAKTLQAGIKMFANGNEDGVVRLKIQISHGIMTMGFFPLGRIPKLF